MWSSSSVALVAAFGLGAAIKAYDEIIDEKLRVPRGTVEALQVAQLSLFAVAVAGIPSLSVYAGAAAALMLLMDSLLPKGSDVSLDTPFYTVFNALVIATMIGVVVFSKDSHVKPDGTVFVAVFVTAGLFFLVDAVRFNHEFSHGKALSRVGALIALACTLGADLLWKEFLPADVKAVMYSFLAYNATWFVFKSKALKDWGEACSRRRI